jgi:2-oxoglutarate ferredoxin oxidoreductase subunit beta
MNKNDTNFELNLHDHPLSDLIRTDRLPWIFCSGCMIGSEIQLVARAIKELEDENKVNRQDLVVVSGIGCSGRGSGYFKLDGFHSTHGRSIPLAIGAKMANPKLKVIVFSGDGDLFAIGGNHIIHAARRNIDITVICVNNHNYGMTGGQGGPTTPINSFSTTTPFGNVSEHPFNLVSLTANAGATYVSRYTSIHTKEIIASVKKGLMHKGFSFIEVVSPCPTYYGKMNNMKVVKLMVEQMKKLSVIKIGCQPHEAIIDYGKEIVCGEFVNFEKSEYIDRLTGLREKISKEKLEKPKSESKPEQKIIITEKNPKDTFRYEILLAGMGGQGLVTSGSILAQASILYEGINATQSQNYGPESRGGLSYSEVILSNKTIHYPKTIKDPYLLVTLTEESFKKMAHHLTGTKYLVIDPDLVKNVNLDSFRVNKQLTIFEVPFTKEAERLGNKVIANIIVLGFISKILDINSESLKKTINDQFKSKIKLLPININAFDRGKAIFDELSNKKVPVLQTTNK